MALQPGIVDISINRGPTKRHECVVGDITISHRHVVRLVQSPAPMQKLRFELSDHILSEASGKANREIELQSSPKLKDSRIRALMTAINIERVSGFPSGQLFLQ